MVAIHAQVAFAAFCGSDFHGHTVLPSGTPSVGESHSSTALPKARTLFDGPCVPSSIVNRLCSSLLHHATAASINPSFAMPHAMLAELRGLILEMQEVTPAMIVCQGISSLAGVLDKS